LLAAATFGAPAAPSQRAVSLTRDATQTAGAERIVFVHGYIAGSCPGMDAVKFWGGLERFFAVVGGVPAQDMATVSYYKCDIDGYDIAGDNSTHNNPFVLSSGRPRSGVTQNASIDRLSRNLAWFVFSNYTSQSLTVNLVGHSMGGLIIREALQHVQAHDPAYPPSLRVAHVVTISSPFGGLVWPGCNDVQCKQFAPGSAYLKRLWANPYPQGAGGTKWTSIGSLGCDIVSARSAISVRSTKIVYTAPCYSHAGYLADLSRTLDAVASAPAGRRHAIAEVWAALHS
jgi:triacylglycerol esterase/lipase EstA (alpha/beta hydrolase family)